MEDGTSIELFSFTDERTTETIVFGEAAREQRRPSSAAAAEVCCRSCGSDLVHPVEWERTGEETWLVLVRCPDCETAYEVAFGRFTMERFIAQLHDQKRALALELDRWSLARFREEVERLLALIGDDRVLPFDF
jgi:ribosomal protein S27E